MFGDAVEFVEAHPECVNNRAGGPTGCTLLHQMAWWRLDGELLRRLKEAGAVHDLVAQMESRVQSGQPGCTPLEVTGDGDTLQNRAQWRRAFCDIFELAQPGDPQSTPAALSTALGLPPQGPAPQPVAAVAPSSGFAGFVGGGAAGTDAGPAGDLEVEFVEDRIGIVLIGIDEFGEDAEDDDTPCLFIEVEDIAEGSPAAQHPQIQPDMALKSIGGKSVLGLSFNATIDVLTSAERPMKIVLGPPPPTKPAKPDEGATGDEDSGEQQALSPVPPEGVPPSRVDGAQTILSPAMAAIKGSEVDDGEELTPTLPASILAAKEAKEQELAKKSKANGKHK